MSYASDLIRLYLMKKTKRIDWLNNRLRLVNTEPATNGKLSVISNLIDLAIELELTIKPADSQEYKDGIVEFKKVSHAAYNKMAKIS